MTLLYESIKVITLQCRLSASRDTVHTVEQIAQTLQIEAGEQDSHEYVRLMKLTYINKKTARS